MANVVSISREILRSRRAHAVRGRTENVHRISRRHLRVLAAEAGEVDVERPHTRADCANVPRPCPFVGCRHHVYLDVHPRSGNLKLNRPELEPQELPADASCVLDIIEQRGAVNLEGVGAIMNMVRERVRQIENVVLERLRRLRALEGHQ